MTHIRDIYCSVAWQCDEKDCAAPGSWHQSNYWSGECCTVDTYGDGDHEEIDEADLPSNDEVERSWQNYARWVIANGTDPLGNYFVKRTHQKKQVWWFRFNRSILGAVMCQARHGKRRYFPHEVPRHIAQYLNLSSRALLQDFKTWKEFTDTVSGVKQGVWFRAEIECEQPRSASAYARDLRKAAQKTLTQN